MAYLSQQEPAVLGNEDKTRTQVARRVLLVDDSPLVRDFVGGLISDWGFQVETRESARAALEAISKTTFDVLVVDINMPEMSGLEMLATLRMREVDTPVIMLSSVSRTSEVLRAIHQGAFDYVAKDEAIEPLRLALVRAIERVRLVGENKQLLHQLASLNAELEARVRDRTCELEQANTRLVAERGELQSTLGRLNETQEQLVQMEKMASIGVLTAGIAHEINNPLAFILPNFELIEEWADLGREGKSHARVQNLEELSKLIAECRRGLDRIVRIVRQLRVFSHPGRQDLGLVDVDAVVRSVVSLVERELSGRATITVSSNHDSRARANEDQLRQVLLNLLINSSQSFVGPRSDGAIEVFVDKLDDEVAIRVSDNGCGIAPEHLRRVFDPFFTTKAVGHGTGMGLAISRDLVKKMGGHVALESHLGHGTVVTIGLPLWRDENGNQVMVEPCTPPPEVVTPRPTRRLSIIIIEDETALLLPLRRMLADQHDVLTFSDSRDGLRCLIERDPPDVIICDVNMPEVSGLELYRVVIQVRPYLAARFVFLTGGESDELSRLVAEGPCRVLEKPVHRKDLVAVIETLATSGG